MKRSKKNPQKKNISLSFFSFSFFFFSIVGFEKDHRPSEREKGGRVEGWKGGRKEGGAQPARKWPPPPPSPHTPFFPPSIPPSFYPFFYSSPCTDIYIYLYVLWKFFSFLIQPFYFRNWPNWVRLQTPLKKRLLVHIVWCVCFLPPPSTDKNL